MSRYHKSWNVLAVLCGLAAAAIGISINTSGVFYSIVSEDLGILRGAFSFHMTIFSLVTAVSTLFVPMLINRFPFKRVLSVAVLIAVLGTGLMAVSQQLWQFYFLGALRGFSTGMFSILTITLIINHWFIEKNGLATSIALGFSGIMGAVFSPVFSQLIVHIGWRGAYVAEATLILLLCLPAILFSFTIRPQDEGLKAYGSAQKSEEEAARKTSRTIGIHLYGVLLFAIMIGFVSSMTQHLPGYAESIGLPVTLGAGLLSMGMLGNIISKLIIGVLSDFLGPLKATLILLVITLIGTILLIQGHSSVLLLLAAFFFGSCYGLGSVSIALVTREIFGDKNYVKIFPTISFAGNVGAALAFSAIGYIYDFTSSYLSALFLLLILLIASTFSLVIAFYVSKKSK
ncbi:MFS transporter [Streptococcus gallolyticus subsp. gallolyticus]